MLEYEDWMEYVILDEKGVWARDEDFVLVGLKDEATEEMKAAFEIFREEDKCRYAEPGFVVHI